MRKKEGEGRTIRFEPDVVRIVEDYRRRQARIPSFSEAVNELIRKGGKKED